MQQSPKPMKMQKSSVQKTPHLTNTNALFNNLAFGGGANKNKFSLDSLRKGNNKIVFINNLNVFNNAPAQHPEPVNFSMQQHWRPQ